MPKKFQQAGLDTLLDDQIAAEGNTTAGSNIEEHRKQRLIHLREIPCFAWPVVHLRIDNMGADCNAFTLRPER